MKISRQLSFRRISKRKSVASFYFYEFLNESQLSTFTSMSF
ncbi:hypothetical protein NC99_17730 [Sunxiuqinia dokdonensis]|uniref:Uncharacterized protein n=1 Tax=Sunxiuqinia dokdonensis TaxID=1409788 RepID=A0A0L8VB19_9BACT|nr:hypothetical protein NC99_17730 [Sunxiuqinia dokdonensis]